MEAVGYVKLSIDLAIATIEFFHPKHNSLPGELLAQLVSALEQAGQSDDVQVIILKSAGQRTFCAGASFDELKSIRNEEEGRHFFSGFAQVINAMRTCGKIVIGVVQGKAVGGGVGLLSATDICMASSYASIRLSELAIGIGPFVIGPAVERKIGLAHFSRLSLCPEEWVSAADAKQLGLYHQVYEDFERLQEEADKLANHLASYNPEALHQLKIIFWEGTEHWSTLLSERAKVSGKLVLGEFTKRILSKKNN